MVPALFKIYLIGLGLLFGQILPIGAGVYLAFLGQGVLAASTLGVYVMTLLAQQVSEIANVKKGRSQGLMSMQATLEAFK